MVATHIDAVLFDIGGVILTSPFEAFNAYEERAGLPRDLIRQLNATNPDSNAWASYERSEVSTEEFCRRFEAEAESAGHRLDARQVIAGLYGAVRPAMVEAVRRCRRHFATAALTNNFDAGQGASEDPSPMADIYAHFDLLVESKVVGVRKPDAAFYQYALDSLAVSADRCVFLDDLGVNLKTARAMGMTTIKVVDPDVALAELSTVLDLDLAGLDHGEGIR